MKEFNFDHIEEFEENLKGIDFNLVKSTFRVDCNRIGDHDFNSQDISRSIGEILFEGYNKKIDFKNPETIIYVDILDNNCFIGIDLTGKLCKRGYRFKVHSSSINACLAYSLVRLSGLKDNEVLLDSFCGDGVVCIEAGFYKKARIIGVDNREGYLKSCRINSKIAKKEIEFLFYCSSDKKDSLSIVVRTESKQRRIAADLTIIAIRVVFFLFLFFQMEQVN